MRAGGPEPTTAVPAPSRHAAGTTASTRPGGAPAAPPARDRRSPPQPQGRRGVLAHVRDQPRNARVQQGVDGRGGHRHRELDRRGDQLRDAAGRTWTLCATATARSMRCSAQVSSSATIRTSSIWPTESASGSSRALQRRKLRGIQ